MITLDSNDSYLMLSGIQHMAFCERQWALIHVEQQWEENVRTVEGKHLHERVDDPFEDESRGSLFISRAVPLISNTLKLQGVADVIEYWNVEEKGIQLSGKTGFWMPKPVEYKRGKPKLDDRDQVQLCAQAMCLEEMLGISLVEGDIFYGETRKRQHVVLSNVLRSRVVYLASRMHLFIKEGVTPPAIKGTNCKSCSLVDLCMPKLTVKKKSVKDYIAKTLREIE